MASIRLLVRPRRDRLRLVPDARARHLLPSDEGRYAEIAREMVASGDWVTIRYNGVKYFEKPPLQMWMTALAFERSASASGRRGSGSALSGAARHRRHGGRGAALVRRPGGRCSRAACCSRPRPGTSAATSIRSTWASRSPWPACSAASCSAQHPGHAGRRGAAGCGSPGRRWRVAVLTKGLIGIVLPGLVLVALHARRARPARSGAASISRAASLVLLAIAAPWFVLDLARATRSSRASSSSTSTGSATRRRCTTARRRGGTSCRSSWSASCRGSASRRAWPAAVRDERRGTAFRPGLLLAVWAVAIFVFFSVSSSKLPGYIVPIYPALAILAALVLDRHRRRRTGHASSSSSFSSARFAAAPFLARLAASRTPTALYVAFATWLAAACVIAIARPRRRLAARPAATPRRSIVAYALTFFMPGTVAMRGHEVFGRSSSGVDLVAPMKPLPRPACRSTRCACSTTRCRSICGARRSWSRRRRARIRHAQEPGKWLPTLDAFIDAGPSLRTALAIMAHPTFEILQRPAACR